MRGCAVGKGKLSRYAKLEAINFCLQYGEWKEAVEDIELTIHSPLTDQGGSHSTPGTSATENAALRAARLSRRIEIIENAVKAVTKKDPILYPYILKGVTDEYATFDYLVMHGMPLCRNTYYKKRHKVIEIIASYL
jgi:hypothetical protein